MIAWTVEAALAAGLDRVVVSTDDADIAEAARAAGAEVPFMRPAALASDTARSTDVAVHAIETLGWHEGTVVLLQPTSPLRTAADILGALDLMVVHGASSCISVCAAHRPPEWTYRMAPSTRTMMPAFIVPEPRPVFVEPNGALYAISAKRLLAERKFLLEDTVAYEMPRERSVDVDDVLDFLFAEFLIQHYG